ncbi:MAG: DEAD/DEAH box helicase [Lysobacteraceae bacterium]
MRPRQPSPADLFGPTVPGDARLVARYAALPAGDQALIELLMLDPRPIGAGLLAEALRHCAPEPEWAAAKTTEVATRMQRLREFIAPARANELRPKHSEAMVQAVLRGLLRSGRARRIAQALMSDRRTVLARLEPGYSDVLRSRLRLAGALGGASEEHLELGSYYAYHQDGEHPAQQLLGALYPLLALEDLAHLHHPYRTSAYANRLWRALLVPDAQAQALFQAAVRLFETDSQSHSALWIPLFDHAVLRGETIAWASRLSEQFAASRKAAEASALLFEGVDAEAALPQFDTAFKLLRKTFGPSILPPCLPGKLHLACLSITEDKRMAQRRQQLAISRDTMSAQLGGQGFVWWQAHARAAATGRGFVEPGLPEQARIDDWWWLGLLLAWSGQTPSAALRARIDASRAQAETAGWTWLCAQIDALNEEPATPLLPALHGWIRPQPVWRSAIDALASALASDGTGKTTRANADRHSRLLVRLNLPEGRVAFGASLDLIEQRPRGEGWTSGRALVTASALRGALDRITPGDDPDRDLLVAILAEADSPQHGVDAGSRVFAALVGHPRVSDAKPPAQALRVEAGEVALRTRRLKDKRVELRIEPAEAAQGRAFMLRQKDLVRVFRPDPVITRIGAIVGEQLVLPAEAVTPLLQLLPDLGRKLKLEADLADLGVAEQQADSRLVAQLEPYRDGLALRIVVAPLGEDGPTLPPGEGDATVLGSRDGQPCRAQRDLAAERHAFEALRQSGAVPEDLAGGERLAIDDPEAALDLLGALQAQPELALAWRAGKPLKVARLQPEGALQIQVSAQRDWFSAKGGLALDDGNVIALSEVLRALPSAQGRYLRLDGDRVVALDAELRRRLHALRSFSDERGNVQAPKTAAFALEGILDEDSERDLAFREQLQRMDAAQTLTPPVPAGLQADLRDYQIEGFRFLMRLASWGAGACLADDMGLGKTVQALAMLCARSGDGPALVVAPTSVVGNWRRETLRFAPGLAVRVYGEGDREQALAELGPGDLVLVSYGLLAGNIDAFAAIRFASLVLDEAQAIKNPATQRAQAVRQIDADFRMAATGTPLENHLGELWSLFRVLNPGLLGSEEHFRRRFLNPLERDPRGPQRDVLRRLISPFLLRRTKAEVLSELPPRTEIVLSVEPSAGEAQLLAALRRQALDDMHDNGLPKEQRRFHVLAALTRLRRAACHPKLVAPELGLPSSKLEQLVELVRELSDNRHRALVFSQFVDYLALVRERFDAEGITYRYLDGSTPAAQRETEVAAFQRGEGEVFLLSLKAGGVGLNLTAADYVIHLDPWWNPAVEQQASDRAHRIGQTRPVTVYKLVLTGSIEEQILALHGAKRELIDQVIGEQSAASIGVEELMALLEN